MWTRTLRGKLTLWNISVLTVTLVLFGLVLNYTNQKRLADDIDRDLWNRARHTAGPRPPRGPGPGPGQGPMGRPPGPPPEDVPPPDDRFGNLRRPERFDALGHLMGPRGSPVFDPALLKQALAGTEGIENTTLDGVPIRVAAVPQLAEGRVIGAVETARELTDFQTLWRGQTLTLLILLPLALVVGGAGALFLTNRALLPIADATRTAAKISEQDLNRRLNVQGNDELAQLSSTFNGMLDRLQSSFEKLKLAYSEMEKAYENQRRFTADASHELRTPLTRLKLATSAALSESGVPKAVLDSLKIADQSAEAMSKIVQQLLLLSKADAGQLGLARVPLDLRVLAAEAVDSLGLGRFIDVRLSESPVMVCGDEDHLRRVVVNLVQNSVRHTEASQDISVEVGSYGGTAVLRVKDEGEGIPAEHLPHLGERFYRVDQARARSEGGFGLGLSICKTIVEGHGGTMQIRSVVGKGTEVRVTLPLA